MLLRNSVVIRTLEFRRLPELRPSGDSRNRFPNHGNLFCLTLGDDLFEASVLVLKLFETLDLAQLKPAILRLPAVVGLLGDAVRTAQVRHAPPGLALSRWPGSARR